MRKIIMLVLLTVLLASAMPGTELMKLEVINKSEYDAYLILQDVEFKYNPVRPTIYKAGENLPKVQLFTIVRGFYNVEASYCGQEFNTLFKNLDLTKAFFRITIPPCDQKNVVDAVVDRSLKLSPLLYPPVDSNDVPIIYDFGMFYFRY